MSCQGPWLASVVVCLTLACKTEVTIHLLEGNTTGDAASDGRPAVCQPLGTEVCNGGDDDCNGIVDDGCTITVVWGDDSQSEVLGHATGGVDFQEPCPRGAILTGVKVGMGTWLNMVAAECRPISINVDTNGTPVLAGLGSEFDTSFAPASSTDMKNQIHDLLCPEGFAVSGIDGTTADVEARYIYGLQVRCAPAIVTTAGGAIVMALDVAREQALGSVACVGCAATQAINFTATVPAGQVSTGLFGGDGLWDDRVGFDSARATITQR